MAESPPPLDPNVLRQVHGEAFGFKTKLLVFTTKQCEMTAKVELATTTLEVDGCTVSPFAQATHIGVLT